MILPAFLRKHLNLTTCELLRTTDWLLSPLERRQLGSQAQATQQIGHCRYVASVPGPSRRPSGGEREKVVLTSGADSHRERAQAVAQAICRRFVAAECRAGLQARCYTPVHGRPPRYTVSTGPVRPVRLDSLGPATDTDALACSRFLFQSAQTRSRPQNPKIPKRSKLPLSSDPPLAPPKNNR